MPRIPQISDKDKKQKRTPKTFKDTYSRCGVHIRSVNGDQAIAEECPKCGKDRFYINIKDGRFDCKHCKFCGNPSIFLTWFHKRILHETTDDHYRTLKHKRGDFISLQTLKRHELAFDGVEWWTPYKDKTGKINTLQTYSMKTGKKYFLPMLGSSLYYLDQLSDDKKKLILLFEGAFDLIAADSRIGSKRTKYDLLAIPGGFKKDLVEYFRDRKLRSLMDNDPGGDNITERIKVEIGESGVAAEVQYLKWSNEYDGISDINDLLRDYPDLSITGWYQEHCIKVPRKRKLILQHGLDYHKEPVKVIDWIWPNRLRCGTYVSYSGQQGTLKSTLMREVVANYTTGSTMHGCEKPEMPAGNVLYIYAEDDKDTVMDGMHTAGADLERVYLIPAIAKNGNPVNVLDNLGEIEEIIRKHDIRLVVIDGQNSVVGTPDISTDMKGRANVTNRLHQFAQKLNICLVGIRNEDSSGRALGSQSMSDISRCVIRSVEVKRTEKERYYMLNFVKVSDAAPYTHPSIPYSVRDLGGRSRKILWGKSYEEEEDEEMPNDPEQIRSIVASIEDFKEIHKK